MKPSPRSWHIWWDVHAWTGMLTSVLLHTMFLCGAIALYVHPLTAFTQPPMPGAPVSFDVALAAAMQEPGTTPIESLSFFRAGSSVAVGIERKGDYAERVLEPGATRLSAPRSELAHFLYELHFLDVVPYGLFVAGAVTLVALIVLITGLLVQWKTLLAQLTRIRWRAGARVLASDLHKVFGVFLLPYFLLFAWSGVVLALGYVTVEPVFTRAVFGGDARAVASARGDLPEPPPASGKAAPLITVQPLLARAAADVPGLRPKYVTVYAPGDAASVVRISGAVDTPFLATGEARYGRDGALIARSDPRTDPPIAVFERWLFGLHVGTFESALLRAAWALFALLCCAVISSGNVVWLERRDAARKHESSRWIEHLSIGGSAGLCCAIGLAFLANRLLPSTIAARAQLELGVFWAAWAGSVVLCARLQSPRRSTGLLLFASGVSLLVTAIATGALYPDLLQQVDGRTITAAFALFGVVFAWSGARLAIRREAPPTPHRAQTEVGPGE